MLPRDPPAWIMRTSGWLLIAFFAIAFLAACLVHLPETVTAPFVLVPLEGADPIQSPYLATLHKVDVSEGDAVKQGQALFVLQSDEIRNRDLQNRTLTEDLREHEASLQKADSAFTAQTSIKDAEIAQAESEVKFRERHSTTNATLVDRMEKLSKNGGISQVELLRLQLDLAASEKDLSVAQRTLQQVNLERQRMEMERSRQRGQDLAEMEKMKFRLAALKSDLENTDQNLLTLRAPYDGVVISLAQKNPGSVVQNGQELCQLARLDSQPRARLLLTESGLPKLAVGQRVRFFFDAYPYQRYGVVNARLDWVSPSVVT
ncbi:MAG: HlyD family efflux transporter periplasmic adaptor subunit, partial [Verrucomicrobiota bacterium]|nr:HlyD family efflux transporter periplasmic adaptor subunit [Verrucomicrobiota bacterium]